MKSIIFQFKTVIGLLFLALMTAPSAYAQNQQDGLGLPGDNLNLSAVLDIFQQAKTLEQFEADLNSDNYKINNLDLDYDGRTDYIKVVDYPDGKLHSIVLQIDINRNESQDVAVIYTEQKNNGQVDIQIVGDESLYGKNYVIDLGNNQSNGTYNPGYSGNVAYDNGYDNYNYVAPSSWNIIVYMYAPSYTRWYSPWYWGYYPRRWNPWTPFFWNDYYYHCYNNYGWHYRNYCYGTRNRFYNHHSNWYGRNRHRSTVYSNNRQRGVYTKTYQGRPPIRKPIAGKPVPVSRNFANNNDRLNNGATRPDNNRLNGRNNATQRVDRAKIQSEEVNRQAPVRAAEGNRPQQIERQQPRPQQIDRQQPRPQQIDRQQPRPQIDRPQQIDRQQPRPQQVERPQQIDRPQPQPRPQQVERPRQIDRPQPQPRPQQVERPQPAERPRMEERQQPVSRPMNNPPARQAPQQAPQRNDNAGGSGRSRR
jgi:hypothetical protein